MKKLMLAAAAATLAGGVFAACTITTTPETVVTNAAVYAWKFTGKTTVGKLIRTTTTTHYGSNCQISSTSNSVTECAIRIPGSLAIQGYVYYCDNCCDAFASGTSAASVEATKSFYMTKPFKDVFSEAEIAIDLAHVIGTKATQYETKGVATFKATEPDIKYTLTFAGLGSFNKNLKVATSVSGNFAGTVVSPRYVARGVCLEADYWLCADLPATMTYACAVTDPSVAYGTWSVRYNASASKKYRNSGTLVKLPSWTGLN